MSKNSIFDFAVMKNIVNNSKDSKGNVNVERAVSIARAKGYNSFIDSVRVRNIANIENKKNKK